MQKRVRAIVLNYNNAKLTAACVSSLLEQDYAPLDIVVVDNNSAAADVRELKYLLPVDIHLVRSPKNVGYSAGNNLGARVQSLPKPDYLLISNNDVRYPDKHTITALVTALQRGSTGVACSPLVDTAFAGLPVESQVQVRRIPRFGTLLVSSSWWLRRLPGLRALADWYTYADERPYPRNQEVECESINGSCFLIDGTFLAEIGYLDEGTFLYQEELILGKQIQERGRTASLVTGTWVLHEQGSTSKHRGNQVQLAMSKEVIKSEIHYCLKYLNASPLQVGLLMFVRTIDVGTKLTVQFFRTFRKPRWIY